MMMFKRRLVLVLEKLLALALRQALAYAFGLKANDYSKDGKRLSVWSLFRSR
jgi:hypothetical protein